MPFGAFPYAVAYGMVAPNEQGMESLGAIKSVGSPTGLTLPNIPVRDALMISLAWKFASADRLGLQFNGDNAANYWCRQFSAGTFIGQLTFSNNQEPSVNSIRMFPAGDANFATSLMFIVNRGASSKILFGTPIPSSGGVTAVSTLFVVAGEWVNITAPITSVSVLGVAGAAFTTCAISAFGRNFP